MKRATVAALELGYQLRDHVDYAREWHQRSMRISMHLEALASELDDIVRAWERAADTAPPDDPRAAVLRSCAQTIRDLGANPHAQ